MLNHEQLRMDCEKLGMRLDAGETAMLAKQLEYVYTRTYDVKYGELKARRYIPVDTSVDPGAEFYTYRQWNMFGMAKIIANYAHDLPRVDALAREFPAKIQSLGASYAYTVQDLRRASMSGNRLDEMRARAARRAHEQAIDDIAAVGNEAAGLTGFSNNANVPLVAADFEPWDTADPLEVVSDINKLVNAIVAATGEVFAPDTLLLDDHSFEVVSSKPMTATGDSDKTIMRFILETNAYLKNIDRWSKLNDAGAGGVTRIVAYPRTEEVLALVIPQDFEQFPPQQRNLEYVVPTHSRIGGVRIQYPLAMAYMDGTGE